MLLLRLLYGCLAVPWDCPLQIMTGGWGVQQLAGQNDWTQMSMAISGPSYQVDLQVCLCCGVWLTLGLVSSSPFVVLRTLQQLSTLLLQDT